MKLVSLATFFLAMQVFIAPSYLRAQIPEEFAVELNEIREDTAQVDFLIEKSNAFAPSDFDLSFSLAKKALSLSREISDRPREALSFKAMGLANGYRGNAQEAKKYYMQAADIYALLGDRLAVADMYMNSGVEFYFSGLYDSSMHYYLLALPVYQELENAGSLGKIYHNMATSYRNLGMDDKALEHFNFSLKYKREIGDSSGQMNSLLNIANLHRLADVIDSSLIYSRKSEALAKSLSDDRTLGLIYQNMCIVWEDLDQMDSAKYYGLKAEKLIKATGRKRELAKVYATLATTYFNSYQCDSTRYYVALFEKTNPGLKMYREKREINKILAACAAWENNYETGYEYQRNQLLYDDSVDVVEQQERLGVITAKYEESVRRAEILEKERELAESEAKRNRLFAITTGSVAALAIALIGIIVLIQRQRRRKAKHEAKIRQQVAEMERLRERLAVQGERDVSDPTPKEISIEEVNAHLINPLTERELEVLKFIASGKSNQAIADEIFVSINTVKTHVNRIYDKLDVHNRTQATLKATELNLVD